MADSSDAKNQNDPLQNALREMRELQQNALREMRDLRLALNAGSKLIGDDSGSKTVTLNLEDAVGQGESFPMAADGTFSIPDIGKFQVNVDAYRRYVKLISWHNGVAPEKEMRFEVDYIGNFTIPDVGIYQLGNGKRGRAVCKIDYFGLGNRHTGNTDKPILMNQPMPTDLNKLPMPMSHFRPLTNITMSKRESK